MAFVVDASVALAWHFRDENWSAGRPIARQAIRDGLVVPPYFNLEIANGLLRGERMQRTQRSEVDEFIARLVTLRVEFHTIPQADVMSAVLPLARTHRLKMYDAGYLHVAMERGLPLATFDNALTDAARAAGVPLLES